MLTISLDQKKALVVRVWQAIGLSMVAGLALAALAIYFCYLCLLVVLLGLQLLVATFNQLAALISATPVLHFFFVLSVLCLGAVTAKWIVVQARRYVLISVR